MYLLLDVLYFLLSFLQQSKMLLKQPWLLLLLL